LNHHHRYGKEMRQSEPGVPRPQPAARLAGEDANQASDNKGDEKRMQQQNRIGRQQQHQG